MSYTTDFATAARAYANEAQRIEEQYNADVAAAERFKGSEAYNDCVSEATAKRNRSYETARQQASEKIDRAIEGMRKALSERGMSAPSQEQISLLTLLEMRETLSENEIKQAANELESCPVAMARLREIARKHGFVSGITLRGAELDSDYVDRMIDSMDRSAAAMIRGEYSYSSNIKLISESDNISIIARMAALPNKVTEDRGFQTVTADKETVNDFAAIVG